MLLTQPSLFVPGQTTRAPPLSTLAGLKPGTSRFRGQRDDHCTTKVVIGWTNKEWKYRFLSGSVITKVLSKSSESRMWELDLSHRGHIIFGAVAMNWNARQMEREIHELGVVHSKPKPSEMWKRLEISLQHLEFQSKKSYFCSFEIFQLFSFFFIASPTEIRLGIINPQIKWKPANKNQMDSFLKIQPIKFGAVTKFCCHSFLLGKLFIAVTLPPFLGRALS